MRKHPALLVLLLGSAAFSFSQDGVPSKGQDTAPPKANAPADSSTQKTSETPAATEPDRGKAYYHYTMAHTYEELAMVYGRSDYVTKAIAEYKKAIAADPSSSFLNAELADLYNKTGRVREAVLEAQEILKRDPNNLDARKLLGRIYLRSLGDMQSGTQSQQMLTLATQQYEEIARLEPKTDNLLLLGRLYRLNNDLAKAEQTFKKAIELDPGAEEAISTLAYLYNEQGQHTRALEILNKFPEASRNAKIYAALGYTHEQQRDYANAVSAYKKAVEIDGDNLDAVRGLAQNLMNAGRPEEALEHFEVIAESDPQDAQTLLRIAEIHRRAGRYEQALDSLNKAGSIVRDSLEVPYNTALIYEAQGKFEEAIQALEKLLGDTAKMDGSYTAAERSNRTVFLDKLGDLYRVTDKPEKAVATFRRMIDLGGEHASRGHQQIIETWRQAKDWKLAQQAADAAVSQFPNDRTLQMIRASLQADFGDPDKALANMKEMLSGDAGDREVYLAIGQVNSRLKRWAPAEEALRKAEEMAARPEEKDYVTFLIGAMYERQRNFEKAEEYFKRALNRDPDNGTVLNYLGYMLAERGVRLEEAVGYIKRALQNDPQNGAYLDSLGWAYFKMGKYELAEANLLRAAERTRTDPTIHDHLGDLYQKMGNLKQAVAHWERALHEWNAAAPTEVEQEDVQRAQKKLDAAKVRLAQQQPAQ